MKTQRRNDELIRQIAERLKAVRRARNLTQDRVRHDTQLNIGRIETGRHSITITTLSDLCTYYGITLTQFFNEAGSNGESEPSSTDTMNRE